MYIAKHDIEIINLEDLAVIVSGLVKEGVTFEVETKDISDLEKHSEIKSAVKYVVTLTGGYQMKIISKKELKELRDGLCDYEKDYHQIPIQVLDESEWSDFKAKRIAFEDKLFERLYDEEGAAE